MFSKLMNDNLKIIKNDNKIIESIKGSVQGNRIFIMRSDILIEKVDIVERIMSNGGIETFEVLNPNFYEKNLGISAHYQMEVVNIKNKKESKNDNNNFNNVYNINVKKAGILSTGSHSINTYNENNINNDIDNLINEIKKLKLADEKQIVLELENLKSNKENAKSVLANLLTRFSEVATITSFGNELLEKLFN